MPLLIHESSLAATLNAVNGMFFDGRPIPKRDRLAVARWIVARQGLPRAYADTFAGTERDLKQGIRLFTGELTTNAAARHILGEESCRALILLDVPDRKVRSALERAGQSLTGRLCQRPNSPDYGWYCCARCSASVWRHLSVGGLDHQEPRLVAGVRRLKQYRLANGRWRAFPFWYTVLALSEIDLPEAKEELRYASDILERAARVKTTDGIHAQRRTLLARQVLEESFGGASPRRRARCAEA